MRFTGVFGLGLAVVMGLIVADIWTHPKGTTAAGKAVIALEKNTGNQLLGHAA